MGESALVSDDWSLKGKKHHMRPTYFIPDENGTTMDKYGNFFREEFEGYFAFTIESLRQKLIEDIEEYRSKRVTITGSYSAFDVHHIKNEIYLSVIALLNHRFGFCPSSESDQKSACEGVV